MHLPTESFIQTVFEQASVGAQIPQTHVLGSHLAAIDNANQLVEQAWLKNFKVALPPAIARRPYTYESGEKELVDAATSEALGKLSKEEKQYLRIGVSHPEEDLGSEASKLRMKVMRKGLSLEALQPGLQLNLPIADVPHVQTSEYRRSIIAHSRDCSVAVFGMNALALLPRIGPPATAFDTLTAGYTIMQLKGRPEAAKYNLGWLLGCLSSDFAQAQAGRLVRTVTTIGADFRDIEDKVFRPIRRRLPDASFILNVVLGSANTDLATHAVTVVGATEQAIQIHDPRKKTATTISPDKLWDRWVATNLQSVILVTNPLPAEA